jgi:glycosyltransferase involved in cell wall biosynthesis
VSGLRFCMVTTFYPPYHFGGDALSVQTLSRALARRGHQVTVIHDLDAFNALHGGPEPPAPEDEDGVEVVRLRSRRALLSSLLTHQIGHPVVHGQTIRKFFGARRFDVIHFHNISLVGGPGILSAGTALKVYMAHEHWLVCPTHVLWRHGREVCTGRECTRCVLRQRRPLQLWRYTDYLERQLDHVDLFLALSEFSRDKHHEFGFSRPMEVLPNFLAGSTNDDATDSGQSPHERPYFLFVGRLERIKGLDDVIPLFREYRDADLLVIGDGDHASALQELAWGNPRVKFLGRLPSDELPRYYRHAIALLAPSVGFETFGIVLIEALRYATPVLARRVGPFLEIVERSGGGELFTTPDELLQAMRRIQGDPVLRCQLARAGYEAFLRHWSEETVLPRYLELIRQTAERTSRPHISEILAAEVRG